MLRRKIARWVWLSPAPMFQELKFETLPTLSYAVRTTVRWVAAAALLLAAVPALADTYDIDGEHTEVRFTWDHLGISRQSGRFTDVSGVLEFDPVKLEASRIAATIPLASIQTGVKKLDEVLLRSGEWFSPDTFPEIRFESTSVEPTSDKTANVSGLLTFNGVSKPVVLEVVWRFAGDHPLAAINPTFAGQYVAGFSAATQIRRSDWGLSRTIPYISDEIRISIETELVRRPLPVEVPPADPTLAAEPMPPTDAIANEAPPSVPGPAPVRAEPLPPVLGSETEPFAGEPSTERPASVDTGPADNGEFLAAPGGAQAVPSAIGEEVPGPDAPDAVAPDTLVGAPGKDADLPNTNPAPAVEPR
ncbi:MAG: YceI family protein [Hyphomicrobium sp.]|nr:YceI family protein [Hyphomicrobium sp.]